VSVLNTKVLVLNRSYLPIHITVVRRALSLLYQGIARAVDEQYRTRAGPTWRSRRTGSVSSTGRSVSPA